jgi:excisionase family DNA binding protein
VGIAHKNKSLEVISMQTALTIDEVSQLLKVTPDIVRQLVVRGELPGRKIGNEWRFSPLAIQLWLIGTPKPENKFDNPHLSFLGALAGNPLAQEVADDIRQERERQRFKAVSRSCEGVSRSPERSEGEAI